MIRARRVAALATSLMLAAAPLHLGTADAATATKTYAREVTVTTYNVRHALSVSTVVADLRRLATVGTDVVALQEMGSRERRNAVRAAVADCETCVYDSVFFDSPAGVGSVPFLYRADRLTYHGSGAVQLSESTYVGPRGAGPSTIDPKWATWVKLQDNTTGRYFYVVNSHAVASVQAPDGGATDNARRIALYRKHMAGLQGLVEQLRRREVGLFVLGDLNVNYRRDRVVQDPVFPFVNLGAVRLQASYERLGMPLIGTHARLDGTNDTRLIDYVYFMGRRVFAPATQAILRGYASDHRPLVVGFTAKGPGPAYVAEPFPRS